MTSVNVDTIGSTRFYMWQDVAVSLACKLKPRFLPAIFPAEEYNLVISAF